MGFLSNLLPKIGQPGQQDGEINGQEWKIQDQTPDERKLCSYIKNKVEEIRGAGSRISSESIWMTNVAYLLGYDSIYYDSNTRSFRPVNAGVNRIKRNRVHSNLILPTCQNRLARLCKNQPKFDIRPESGSQDDKDKARENLEILTQLWEQEGIKLNRQRIPLLMWAQQCGHAYIQILWDETLGKPLIDPISGEVDGYEGDIRADVCSAFECFPDPLAKNIEDMQYMIRAKVRKLDYFCTQYPERGPAVKEEGAWLLSTQYEQRINSINKNTSGSGSNEQMKGAAIELSYYEKRSRKYPHGRHCVTANGVLLRDKELLFGEIPFTKFDDIIIAGKFYSEAIITHLRPLQDQLNRNLNNRASWTNKLLKGKYIAAKGHGIAQESLNDENGEVVEYTPVPNAQMPSAMTIPTIPQYVYLEEKSLKEDFAEISGISEVSKGQLPSASIPAVGMQLLQEQDETRIGIQTEFNEDAFARVGKQLLLAARVQYITPRKRKMAGKNGEYNIKEFRGEDIGDTVDVTVIRGSTIPTSKALRRQELINLYSQGFLGDPADPNVREKMLGLMEYGDIGEVWIDQSLDMQQIKKTLTQVEQGIVPEANELDNHALHVQEKNRYRKGDKFDLLGPERQQILIADINAHLDWIVKLSTPPGAIETPNPDEHVAMDNLNHDAQMKDLENQANLAPPPIEQVGQR